MLSETSSPTYRKNRLRWFVLISVSLVTVLVMAVVFFASEMGSRFLLTQVKKWIERVPGGRFEYAQGDLRLWNGFRFENLYLRLDDPDLKIEIKAPRLELRYSLHLWTRRLIVERVDLARLEIAVEDRRQLREPEPSAQKSSALSWLAKPPMDVQLRDLSITGLRVRYQKAGAPEGHTIFEIPSATLTASGEISQQRYGLKGDLQSTWRVDLKQALGIGLLGDGSIQAKWEVEAKPAHLLGPSERFMKRLNIEARVDTGPLTVTSATRQTLKIGSNQFSLFASDASETIKWQARARMADLHLPALLRRPTALEASAQGEVDFALTQARATADLRAEGGSFLQIDHQQARKDQSWKSQGAATVDWAHLQKRLLRGLLKAEQPSLAAMSYLAQEKLLIEYGVSQEPSTSDEKNQIKLNLFVPDLRLKLADHGGGSQKPVVGSLRAVCELESQKDRVWPDAKVDLKVTAVHADWGEWALQLSSEIKPGTSTVGDSFELSGRGQLDQLKAGDVKRLPLVMARPLITTHHLQWREGQIAGDLKMRSQGFDLPGLARFEPLALQVTLTSSARPTGGAQGSSPDVTARLEISQGAIELDPGLANRGMKQIEGFKLLAEGELTEGDKVRVRQFSIDLHRGAVKLEASGAVALKRRSGEAELILVADFAPSLPAIAGHRVSGRIKAPARLTLVDGKNASFEGSVDFENLNWSQGNLAIRGLHGRMPFAEKITIDDTGLRFQYLLRQNPFERVDFERVRPLLFSAEALRITGIDWEERRYGPFQGFFSLRQNLLSAHLFDLDLGSGRLSGEAFVDFTSGDRRVGLLSRLTALDLAEVMPSRYLQRLSLGEKRISGRSGFIMNLDRAAIDGRVDITEIGSAQMIALANTIDPDYSDEKLNRVRSLLEVGYPTAVGVGFREGYMTLDITLEILGLKRREVVRDIPVASLLSKTLAETFSKSKRTMKTGVSP